MEVFLDVVVLGVASEVGPFHLVDGMVVEFLGAVGVSDVAPSVGPDGMVVAFVGGKCGPVLFGLRILEQGEETVPLEFFFGIERA